MKPEIIYEDTHLIVLDKPAGLLSQGEKTGDENLVDWLRGYLGRPYVGLVHRLDRNTSGIMVVAKRTKSAQRLTDALQGGNLCRTYLAWVEGTLPHEARWRHRLLKDQKTNVVRVVSATHPQGKDAVLRVVPLRKGKLAGSPLTLVQFDLETGRSHQIRVQSAHEGFPLLGDSKYGSGSAASRKFGRPALHSARISFPHPMSGETVEYECPIPADMRAIEQS